MSYDSTPPPPPPPPSPASSAAAPPNYLVWAILSTVLCFWPLGIASIVFSTQVNSKWARGDVEGAQASSRKAKTFAILTAVVGLVGIVIVTAVVLVAAGNAEIKTTP
jgi:uncharacterized membrane protein